MLPQGCVQLHEAVQSARAIVDSSFCSLALSSAWKVMHDAQSRRAGQQHREWTLLDLFKIWRDDTRLHEALHLLTLDQALNLVSCYSEH